MQGYGNNGVNPCKESLRPQMLRQHTACPKAYVGAEAVLQRHKQWMGECHAVVAHMAVGALQGQAAPEKTRDRIVGKVLQAQEGQLEQASRAQEPFAVRHAASAHGTDTRHQQIDQAAQTSGVRSYSPPRPRHRFPTSAKTVRA